MKKIKRIKKVTKPTDANFYQIFIGEYVEILCKQQVQYIEEDEAGNTISQLSPMVFNGYVTDMDSNYLFIGPELNSISQAVKRDEIVTLYISEPNVVKPAPSKEDNKEWN